MTHVVTGATGLLGANLVRTLVAAGHRVRAVGIDGADARDVAAAAAAAATRGRTGERYI